jgi:flavin reductase (DIM6/NTAB) family NADH-FMN oxidoreductase RutF
MASQAFTVNVPDASLLSYVKFAGKYSGKDMNKFEETGLTPVQSEFVNAPYIKEFPIVLECKLTEYHDLGSHRQFIGQVVDAKIDERLLNEEDKVNMDLFNPLVYGQGEYYSGLDLIENISEIIPEIEQ